ncbi:hypothetical protein CMI37_17935 [Candidatus Pacearchaeota archaeon]|nr:hypothetical protein [Candidatus Pacearchaeota archaeon]
MPKFGTDYTKSAIDLKNPLEVRDLLLAYGKAEAEANAAREAHEAAIIDMPTFQAMRRAEASMEAAHANVKTGIEKCGSLQDIPEGLYALKQGRQSVTYNPGMVRETMPQFAEAVIVETVDQAKIHGLVKGGLIDDTTLERIEVRTDLAPAYIIGLATVPKAVTDEPN